MSMQNERDNPADQSAGNNRANKSNHKLPRKNRDRARRGRTKRIGTVFAALELIGLVFWILSEKIHGSWIIHASLLSMAVIFFTLGATHLLSSIWERPLIAWSMGGLLSAVIAFIVFATSRPELSKQPHLKLSLMKVDARRVDIQLTNSFLVHDSANSAGEHGFLFIPRSPTESNTVLHFSLVNDSSVRVREVEVIASISKGLKCAPDKLWRANVLTEGDATTTSLIFQSPFIPEGQNGIMLPPLAFSPPIANEFSKISP